MNKFQSIAHTEQELPLIIEMVQQQLMEIMEVLPIMSQTLRVVQKLIQNMLGHKKIFQGRQEDINTNILTLHSSNQELCGIIFSRKQIENIWLKT